MRQKKVFNIGFHKTGTSSLTQFMRELDFKVLHSVSYSMLNLGLGSQDNVKKNDGIAIDLNVLIDDRLLLDLIQKFEFFSDNPWPLLYKRLDRTYPDGLFILTKRNVDSWMNSLIKHTGNQRTRMQQMIYGYTNPSLHRSTYKKMYLSHNRAVEEYFYGKKNFISIDLEENNSVISRKLQAFLDVDSENLKFPSINRRNK